MRWPVLLTAGALVLAGAWPQAAVACSWGYKRGYSPEEIKRRTDVTAVRANFRFEEMRGGNPASTKRAKKFCSIPRLSAASKSA